MSSQDGLTGQLKDSPAREISDSLLFNDGWGGREGGTEAGIVLLLLFIIMSK